MSHKPKKCRTLAQVRDAFKDEAVRRYWTVCVDSGGHFLRYTGPNREGLEPEPPIDLLLAPSPYELLAEALVLAGIPAEQA
jgi:hypothetical protein